MNNSVNLIRMQFFWILFLLMVINKTIHFWSMWPKLLCQTALDLLSGVDFLKQLGKIYCACLETSQSTIQNTHWPFQTVICMAWSCFGCLLLLTVSLSTSVFGDSFLCWGWRRRNKRSLVLLWVLLCEWFKVRLSLL